MNLGVGLDQDVLGFDVAVDEVEGVDVGHGLEELAHDKLEPGQSEVGLGTAVPDVARVLVQVVLQELRHLAGEKEGRQGRQAGRKE